MPRKAQPRPDPWTPGRLRHANDREAGLHRVTGPKGFAYVDDKGRRVTRRATLDRIRVLAIPPAWTDVWICADERGHLQATGRDAKGRKQYRYHPRWRMLRDADKFDRLLDFAEALPAIRERVRKDLASEGLTRAKVLAAIVQLLERTCIRVGNERYAEENASFGLTTLRNRHVKVRGDRIEFQFRGKSGKLHRVGIEDPRLARIVRRCRELPGQELFEYVDDAGEVQRIGSGDVNEYLHEIAGDEFTSKDFRTWAGSVYVAALLRQRGLEGEVRLTDMAAAVREAARLLGNTPAVCRKSYVHPRVLDPATWSEGPARRADARVRRGLHPAEAALVRLLTASLTTTASRRPAPRRPIPASQGAALDRP
ncbi:MAG TPA: DNA topoisomerase IB [Usitatibacter sp.]|nr:DNA topoisomerase IB [Usitatibacter sp.]